LSILHYQFPPMHYLIDGHNLIGKMPDIQLSDPNDEVKLVLRLQEWLNGRSSQQATVIFDGRRLMGGVSNPLSSRQLTVIFSPDGIIADDLIIRRIKQVKNIAAYTVVSSDRMVANAAQSIRMKTLSSDEFIERAGFVFDIPKKKKRREVAAAPETDNPIVTDAEVAEWLDLFGPVPERKPATPSQPKQVAPPSKPKPKARQGSAFTALASSENPELNDAEIAEWMELFQEAEPSPAPKKKAAKKKKQTPKPPVNAPKIERTNDVISDDDLSTWQDWFGQ